MAWTGGRRAPAGGSGEPSEHRKQLEAFRRGLYPILLGGDLDAFRRYLSQWEEVIGDSAELTEAPPDQQRRLMTTLLRSPQQFNLPAWPAAGPPESRPGLGVAPEGSFLPGAAPPETDKLQPADPPVSGHAVSDTVYRPPAPPDAVQAARVYQVDMLTGELVPVARGPASAAPVAEATEMALLPVRRRRRRGARNLRQLRFWPEAGD